MNPVVATSVPANRIATPHGIVPPILLERIANNPNLPDSTRDSAKQALILDSEGFPRALPRTRDRFGRFLGAETPSEPKVPIAFQYDAEKTRRIRKTLTRQTGEPPVNIERTQAYEDINNAYDFNDRFLAYLKLYGYNSIDNKGMNLHQTVWYDMLNAFYNQTDMVFGIGDGDVFGTFVTEDVNGHEYSHGLLEYINVNGGLPYRDIPGALNEHHSDWRGKEADLFSHGVPMDRADPRLAAAVLIGDDYALRTFLKGPAFKDHPSLGTDIQDGRWNYNNRYRGNRDNGGVHINSKIGNVALWAAALASGGYMWETVGPAWDHAFKAIASGSRATYKEFALLTLEGARILSGDSSLRHVNDEVVKNIQGAWNMVGVLPSSFADEFVRLHT